MNEPVSMTLTTDVPLRLAEMLCCGQVFRWRPGADGRWYGSLRGTALAIRQQGRALRIEAAGAPVSEAEVRTFLGIDQPEEEIRRVLARDPILRGALAACTGLRIVQQDPWESLVAFICSSHNNVLRIEQMTECLAREFGDAVPLGDRVVHTFPEPERLAGLDRPDLAPCRLGYRDAYVLEAARKVSRGELDPRRLVDAPYQEARDALLTVPGVGRKVADCIMLMGMRKMESAFPIDVWVRRAVLRHYRDAVHDATGVELAGEEKGLTDRQYEAIVRWAQGAFGAYTGYAQTCLFYAIREGLI